MRTITVFPLLSASCPRYAFMYLPSESTWDSGCSTLNTREQGVEHSLTSEQGVASRLLLGDGSGSSDRPELHHRVFLLLALELGLKHDILHVSSRSPCTKSNPTSMEYEPLSAIRVMVPIARGGSRILWLSTSEFSYTLPKISPPEMWSPTLKAAGLKSQLMCRSRDWVLIPPARQRYGRSDGERARTWNVDGLRFLLDRLEGSLDTTARSVVLRHRNGVCAYS